MRRLVIALSLVVAVAVAVAVATTLVHVVDAAPESPPAAAPRSSRAGAEGFFDRYVTDAGQVVRHDQGGDTVSEGQAYALQIALAAGQEDQFVRVWRWTRDQLQRDDDLFAWRWRDGRVVDPEPAADADVDIAVALAQAARRFERPTMARAATRIAASVLAHETVTTDGRQLLAAGPWATSRRIVNPSYSTPCGFGVLEELTADSRWGRLADDFEAALAGLLDHSPLPPDWAVAEDGVLVPTGAPDTGQPPSYGLDAQRISIRLATCGGSARRLAARLWPRLDTLPRGGSAVAYSLQGVATTDADHPVGLLGAAFSAAAAGQRDAAQRLVARARRWDRRTPTYYGAAWLALVEPELDHMAPEGAAPVASPTRSVLLAARPAAVAPTPPSTMPSTTTTAPTTTTTRPPTTTTSTSPPTTSTSAPSSTTTTRAGVRRPTSTLVPAAPSGPSEPPGPSVGRPPGAHGGTPTARSNQQSGAPPAPPRADPEVALGRLSPRELVPTSRPDVRASRAEIRFRRVSGVVVGGLAAAVLLAGALGLIERSRIRPKSNDTS